MYVRPRPRFRPRNAGSGNTPSLALEFNQLSALPSYVTFSRGTQAMQYGSDGTLQYAPNNLLTYSNQADNAAWTKSNSFVQTNLALYSEQFDQWALGVGTTVATNAIIAPDGTVTADRVSFATGGAPDFLRRTATLTVGVTYTVSVYAQSTNPSPTFYFDVGNGGVVQSPNQTPTSTWQRFSYTFVFAGANQWVDIETNAPGSIFFWGGQIVQGSVPGNYQATTSAALPVLYADYNGALRARKLAESTATAPHYAYQGVYPAATYTISCYAKQGERTRFGIGNVNSGNYAYFNLATGVVTNAGTGDVSGGTMISLGNGWYRCYAVCAATTSWSTGIITTDAAGNITYTGDGSSGIYIADAQLTPGYLPLAVTETTSAAVYGPRFDYDPVTKVARGLLIEEQRTNLATFSNTFSDASWVALGTKNVAASAIISPEGVANAWTLTDSSAVAFDGIQKSVTVAADGTTYTGSIYILKTAGGTSSTFGINLAITGGTTVTNQPRINTDTGAVLGGTATVTNAGLWWRVSCSVTNNSSVGNTNLSISLYPSTAAYNSATDTAAATGSATIYGAQMETGAFATSYIPTVGSTATRNADSASITTLTPWFNAAAGTLYVSALRSAVNPSAAPVAFEIGDGTNNNRYLIYNPSAGTTSEFFVANGGVVQAQINVANGFQANVVGKVAGAYQINDFQQASNATLGTADTSGTLPTVTAAYIGRNGSASAYWNGWIGSLRYYPTRLPNASLQSITV